MSSVDQPTANAENGQPGEEISCARSPQQDLLDELDNLAEKVDQATDVVRRLRGERQELHSACERLRGEQNRLFQVTGVDNYADLLAAVGRLKQLLEENRTLQIEREEVSKRLEAIIEKVDLVQRDF